MVKVFAALVAALMVVAGGYFGFEFYLQQRIAAEVEAAFAELRAGGAKASHGKVSFELWTRTVTVTDISGESAAQPPVIVKIGKVVTEGSRAAEAGRFTAARIEASGIEIGGTMSMQAALRLEYKMPRVTIMNYSGPSAPLRRLDPSAPGDIYRFALEHFAAVTAVSVSAPTVIGTMSATGAPAAGTGEYVYSGLALRDIGGGKIASMTMDRVSFTTAVSSAGKQEKLTGEIVEAAAYDFDAAAALALFDPARVKDDRYYRAYRQMKTGAYTARFEQGFSFRIDSMSADDIGLRPSKLQIADLMAIVDAAPPPGTTPTPEQMRDLLVKVGGIYEGFYIGAAEVRGLAMEIPGAPMKLALMRLGKLENGKIAEFAVEGLDARSPQGPVKIDRLALKSLDVANLMRTSALLATSRNPSPDQLMGLLLLLEGTEIKGLVAPYKDTQQPVSIDTLNLSWGQFVGPIPTRARATLKMTGPVDPTDPAPFGALAAAGMGNATVVADLGAAWAEGARAFALEPATLEIGGLFTAAARMSLGGVAREVFSMNPLQAALMAAQIEAGPIEIALRDTGGVDLLVAQYARTQAVTREEARRAIVETVRGNAMQMASANPDAMAIAGAIVRFIESPRGTLTLKLTPRGRVAAMQVIEALRVNPMAALARFQVEATNGR